MIASRCNDCTDFVSQAIDYGGFTPDNVWYPQYSSWAWKGVGNLWNYLYDNYTGTVSATWSSVTVGDLAFVGFDHVGMITNINPHRFSGHTNDRWNYPMDGMGFNRYMHFWDTITKP